MTKTLIELIQHHSEMKNAADAESERHLEILRTLEAAAVAAGISIKPLLRKPSIVYMSQVVLREAGAAQHATLIARRIGTKYGKRISATSLGTILHREAINNRRIFYKDKHAENTYGLLSWDAEPVDLRKGRQS